MAAISNTLLSALSQNKSFTSNVAASATASQGTGNVAPSSTDTFGDAVNVTLSAAAQSSGSGASTATNAAPAGGPPAGGAQAPITTTTTTSTDLQTLIAEAKQQAAVKIGYSQAANVVDSQGNIDNVKLLQIEAQQAAQAQQEKLSLQGQPNQATTTTIQQVVNLVA